MQHLLANDQRALLANDQRAIGLIALRLTARGHEALATRRRDTPAELVFDARLARFDVEIC